MLTANVERWTGLAAELDELNAFISAHSLDTRLIFACLPGGRANIHSTADADRYVAGVNKLTKGLPPCVLVSAGRMQNIITSEI